MTANSSLQIWGAIFFGLAIVHTFLTKPFLVWARKYPDGSSRGALLHLLGEIEVVFGIWAALLMLVGVLILGFAPTLEYLESVNFTEALFVFCVMVMAATKPILWLAQESLVFVGKGLARGLNFFGGVDQRLVDFFVILSLGPLLGSFITEPAAMTVTALLLFRMLQDAEAKLLHFLLAVLFVNVSIGGSLTHFAAPPILMVAGRWGWDMEFVFRHFGWKSALAVMTNSLVFVLLFRKSIVKNCMTLSSSLAREKLPLWIILVQVFFLVILVLVSHHAKVTMGWWLLFLGWANVTRKYQSSLKLKEALLVAFFLAGIVVFGAFQSWWLQPLLSSLDELTLFFSAVGLTAFTDNAALTFLGSQVQGLSRDSQYYLVAGALAGGGLTVIANAPNAAGFSILNSKFKNSFSPLTLFFAAILPTLVAVIFLEFLPSL